MTECLICASIDNAYEDATSCDDNNTEVSCEIKSTKTIVQGNGSYKHDSNTDLWARLTCGFSGCGSQRKNHIKSHYEETLHTYVMNVDARGVWDFAGDGYVHRLTLNVTDSNDDNIQNDNNKRAVDNTEKANEQTLTLSRLTSDAPVVKTTSCSSASSSLSSMKIVESIDQNHLSPLRNTDFVPDHTQETIVNRYLEEAAQHYNRLLAWRMAQQREFYEMEFARLNSIVTESTEKKAREEDFRKTFEAEKTKIQKQTEAAQNRLARVEKELEVNAELKKSLKSNVIEKLMESGVKGVREDMSIRELECLEDARHESKKKELQTKIDELMLKMSEAVEGESKGEDDHKGDHIGSSNEQNGKTTGSSCSSSSSSCSKPSKGGGGKKKRSK